VTQESVQLLNHFYLILNQKTGLVLTRNQHGNLKSRLMKLFQEFSINEESLESVLSENPAAFEKILEEVLINESYFFRNEDHFRVLREIIFPVFADKSSFSKEKSLRALSVGCSTGQEPLSILMAFFESPAFKSAGDFHVDAIDLSKQAIVTALKADYNRIQCRGLTPVLKEKYFQPSGPGSLRPDAGLLEKISYVHGNILNHELFEGVYDLIFARNTLIYFDDVNSERVKQKLIRALKPGGYLFLGESEIGWGLGERVQPMKFNQSIIYRKR